MAKVIKKPASGPPQKAKAYAFPSRFGSHTSMLRANSDELAEVGKCVCEDEYGIYFTELSRLDSGLADPNRYAINRLTKLFEKTVKEDK